MPPLQIIQSHMDQLLHGSVRDTLQVGSSLIPIHTVCYRRFFYD